LLWYHDLISLFVHTLSTIFLLSDILGKAAAKGSERNTVYAKEANTKISRYEKRLLKS